MAGESTVVFPALGTSVFVAVRDPADRAVAHLVARTVLDDVDQVASRFRDDSDLTRVNRHPGRWVEVDPLLVAAVAVACEAAWQTGGLVHPLLGRPLVLLGYDRDFQLIGECDETPGSPSTDTGPPPGVDAWRRIDLDKSRIRIPEGTALDLGATGKAWAADLIAAAFEHRLRGSAIVSVGGDLRIAAPDGLAWPVAVAERPGDDPDAVVELDRGGLATSSTQVRRWRRHGADRHHLLDPRTGLPVAPVWRTVTATGATCTAANTASTAAIVLGEAAPAWLDAHGIRARLVATDGTVRVVAGWPDERSAA
ncbi:MAG: hypothetical protein JWO11_1128 [Nocardioides sp.]|nr:hypothetical protein [Nocardioides sp.]